MDPAPQGGYVVRSIPAYAGRRGRRNPDARWIGGYDWMEITDFARLIEGYTVRGYIVPAGSVDILRRRYPEFRFDTHRERMEQPAKQADAVKVCDVYVTYVGEAGDADSGTDAGDRGEAGRPTGGG